MRNFSVDEELKFAKMFKALCLWDANLSDIPQEVWEMTFLKRLVIGNSQLSEIPSDIGQLTNLEYLELYNCGLSSISPEIGRLSKLFSITLSRNNLSELPDSINDLDELICLDLSGNPNLSLKNITKELTIILYGEVKIKGDRIVWGGDFSREEFVNTVEDDFFGDIEGKFEYYKRQILEYYDAVMSNRSKNNEQQ
ncbi:leucine-rich repeat domain-containing protein [Pseudomonadales bacterium]|nr:leucine-rich repeat domain-containing protein [Pseudomonadales bacterium]